MKPILFQMGSYSLHTFGLMVGLGFLLGLWAASRNAIRAGLDPQLPYDLSPWLILGGLVGARAMYVISYWDRDFAGQPWTDIFAIWQGGLVFYGGLIGGTAAGIFRVTQLRLPLWKAADVLAPGVALGHVFGRMGCLLNGCCYGRPTLLPWGITYPHGHVTFPTTAATAIAVHPAPIYESLLNLGFFLLLTVIHRRRRFDGQVFGIYLIGYAAIRSFCELFRGDYSVVSDPLHGTLTPGQWTSLLTGVLGIALFIWRRSVSSGRVVSSR